MRLPTPRKLPKPSQLVLGTGVLLALFVIASGIVPVITQWHDTSHVQREVLTIVPDPVIVAFYASIATMLLVVAWLASLRVRNYGRGGRDDRRTTRQDAGRRLRDFRGGGRVRTVLRDPAAGLMHW